MRFVTFAEADRDCAGVLDSGQVHALPPGVRLIDLIGDPGRLEEAGDRALRRPHAVHARGSVRLRAPIPSRHQTSTGRSRTPSPSMAGQCRPRSS